MLGKFKTEILSSADLQASPHIYSRRSRLLFAFPLGKGIVSRKAVFSYRSLPHWGRGTAQRRSGALVNDALETIFFALFHTARTLSGSLCSPPSPRGEGFVRRYSFSTYACICSDNARKVVFSFRSLPHWGRGTAQRRSGALVNCRFEMHFLALFHTASLHPTSAPSGHLLP